jgi:hypothetical protein
MTSCSVYQLYHCGKVNFSCTQSREQTNPDDWSLLYLYNAGPWTGIGLALSNEEGPLFEGVPSSYSRKKV